MRWRYLPEVDEVEVGMLEMLTPYKIMRRILVFIYMMEEVAP